MGELDSVLLILVSLFSTLTFPLLPLSTLSSLLPLPTTQNSPLPLSTPVLLPSQLLTLPRLLRPRLLMLLLLKLLPPLLLTGRSVRLTLPSLPEPPLSWLLPPLSSITHQAGRSPTLGAPMLALAMLGTDMPVSLMLGSLTMVRLLWKGQPT